MWVEHVIIRRIILNSFAMKKKIMLLAAGALVAITPASFADVDDNSLDLTKLQTRIMTLQAPDPLLPSGVAEPKGLIGFILSKIFNESGQISNALIKALGVRTDGRVLRWS